MSILVSILVFGVVIMIHELGHFIMAKSSGIRVNEFSIGMGPQLFGKKVGDTEYSVRALPIGGYVAMEGEDEESDAEDSFNSAPVQNRIGVVVAGAVMNMILGFLVLLFLTSRQSAITSRTVYGFYEGAMTQQTGLMAGDEIVAIGGVEVTTFEELEAAVNKALEPVSVTVIREGNHITLENVEFPEWENANGKYALIDFETLGEGRTVGQFYKNVYAVSSNSALKTGDRIIRIGGTRVYMADQVSYEIMRKGHKPVDIVVIRDGEEIPLDDVVFPTAEEQGQIFGLMDFKVDRIEKNLFTVIGYSFSKAGLTIKMCGESIIDLITGRYTLAAVSGPVGISQVIGQAANQGFISLLSITSLISINLGAMNLLPIPALDGGRTVMILVEMITKKKLPPKVEGTINAVGLIVLLGLSVIIMIKDVIGLFI